MATIQPVSLIICCEGLGGTGAVANVAWQQALGLSRWQPVCLLSDGLSLERRGQLLDLPVSVQVVTVEVPSCSWLRRLAHLPRQLAWIGLALGALRQRLPAHGATVICHSHPLAAAVAFWFGRRVQLVLVSHGDIFHRPPGTYDAGLTWLYRCTTGYAHRRADRSVALSPVMRERIRAHGVPSDRIALIPNGLDPEEIGLTAAPSRAPAHWHQQPLQLLFVGRLDPVKGIEVMLEALALALQAGMKLQLDLIGSGPPGRLRQLEQRSCQLGIDATLRWLGPQPRHSLAAHYGRSHLVLVPSLDDPLPTVVLEAMACGRPVLGSAVGGIPYLLGDGEGGVLVPPGQPRPLAEALARLDGDRNALAALGAAALARSRHHTWAANGQALEALIRISSH